jgi:hypothetical protein
MDLENEEHGDMETYCRRLETTFLEPDDSGTFLSFFRHPSRTETDNDVVVTAGYQKGVPLSLPQTEVVFDLIKYHLPDLTVLDCANLVDVRFSSTPDHSSFFSYFQMLNNVGNSLPFCHLSCLGGPVVGNDTRFLDYTNTFVRDKGQFTSCLT